MEWQLRRGWFWSNRMDTSIMHRAVLAEWRSPALPESNLRALRMLATSYNVGSILHHGKLTDVLLDASNGDGKMLAETLEWGGKFYTAENCDEDGRVSPELRGELQWMVVSVAQLLSARWTGTHSEASSMRRAADHLLWHVALDESAMEKKRAHELGLILIDFTKRFKNAMKYGGDVAWELGFLRELTPGEILALRRFSKVLNRELGKPGWKESLAPIMELLGLFTPESFLRLAQLTEEYNLQWALASLEVE